MALMRAMTWAAPIPTSTLAKPALASERTADTLFLNWTLNTTIDVLCEADPNCGPLAA
jgi:hypothetical protein